MIDDKVLIISGGGSKGLYILDFLSKNMEILEDIKLYSGVSIGSIISAFLACEITPTNILKIYVSHLNKDKAFKLDLLSFINECSLNDSQYIKSFLKRYLNHFHVYTPKDFKTPVHIYATCLENGESVNLSLKYPNEPIENILMASCAIPGLFKPVKIQDNFYIDGVFSDNCPTRNYKDYEQVVIINVDGNNLIPPKEEKDLTHMYIFEGILKSIGKKLYIKEGWEYYNIDKPGWALNFPKTKDQLDIFLNS